MSEQKFTLNIQWDATNQMVVYRPNADWSFQEWDAAISTIQRFIDENTREPQVVPVMYLLPENFKLPPNFLSKASQIAKRRHPRAKPFVIVMQPGFVQTMITIYAQLVQKIVPYVILVKSEEEGMSRLAAYRARQDAGVHHD
jgi:hypothetical protein